MHTAIKNYISGPAYLKKTCTVGVYLQNASLTLLITVCFACMQMCESLNGAFDFLLHIHSYVVSSQITFI